MPSYSTHFQETILSMIPRSNPAFANSKTTYWGEEKTGFIPREKKWAINDRISLFRRWPWSFNGIVGQLKVLILLLTILKLETSNQLYFFVGKRGIGKTSIAQIFCKKLACDHFIFNLCIFKACWDCKFSNKFYVNIDCADTSATNIIETIKRFSKYTTIFSSNYIPFFLDEIHNKKAEEVSKQMIRLVEDSPSTTIIFAINESIENIDRGLLTRGEIIHFPEPSVIEVTAWLCAYARSLGADIPLLLCYVIAMKSDSNCIPRQCLKILQKIFKLDTNHIQHHIIQEFKLERNDVIDLENSYHDFEAEINKECEKWEY